jgi:phospholipid:diacylglycerol acyltransferase
MASLLRRRILGGGTPTPSDSREGTPEKAEDVRLVPVSKIKGSKKSGGKRWHWFIFILGGLAGIVAAGLFARSNDLIEFPEFGSMDALLEVLPANFVRDARDLMVRNERREKPLL